MFRLSYRVIYNLIRQEWKQDQTDEPLISWSLPIGGTMERGVDQRVF